MLKTVKFLGLSLVVLSFVLLLAFFLTLGQGGESLTSASGEPIHVPLLTDTIIYWGYVLFGLAILVAVGVALVNFVKSFITNPGSAIKSIIPVILFLGIFVVSYLLGSGERLSIIGYEGTQNEGLWAQITDMFIYTLYTLFVILIVTIFGARIYSALK
ncbi:MAG: hypothetical protein LWW91_09400 [Bacteroidales bacterium]|jgi:hypothetical protein|nr:MAG: hypothetical protein F9K10_01315 [Paludibacter sp.]MCE1156320.1 hypothetical protein [Bacteroidales bacterium]OJX91216.1 MAG: hypothetical protein BGP01_12410 [Paludibacter sp. 47-17]